MFSSRDSVNKLLQTVAAVDVIYGALHVYFHDATRSYVDESSFYGILFGGALIFYGQTLVLVMQKEEQDRPPVGMIMGGKLMLCIAALAFSIIVMADASPLLSTTLVLYTILGLPILAAIHQGARGTSSTRTPGLTMSASERAALAERSAPPPSAGYPPSQGGYY
mmetsp:Transcript_25546/g.58041  ORF Transcript_25546/g.58041 Transcript_25546/m.58041 type:complete len:165 (-) Transcript_25546:195-689(-)